MLRGKLMNIGFKNLKNKKYIKGQSTIEFMSTYGFMFLVLGIAILAIFLLTTYTNTIQDTTCNSFSNIMCNFVEYYYNTTYNYGVLQFAIENGQSTPINITNISSNVTSISSSGVCSPSFLYPAQESLCKIIFNKTYFGSQVTSGVYNINLGYCNSKVTGLNESGCIYNNSVYGGAFDVYPSNEEITPFVSIIGLLPNNIRSINELSQPTIPNNYTIIQNGDFVSYTSGNSISYALGNGAYIGNTYFGLITVPYPGLLSSLNNQNIACSSPYNSLLSISYTSFYMYDSNTISISAYATNAIQVYYKNIKWQSWVPAFTSSWNGNSGLTQYISSNFIPSGNYELAIAQTSDCGNNLQAFKINGIYS
ncbi:MAG: hypothetical protein QXD23_01025 [Candidatus Micrarchaeaceae archaeon]